MNDSFGSSKELLTDVMGQSFERQNTSLYQRSNIKSFNRNRPVLGIVGDDYHTTTSLLRDGHGVIRIHRPIYSQNRFNEKYEEKINDGHMMRFFDNVFMPRKEKRTCSEILMSIFPLINMLRHYVFLKAFPYDLLSGITTGVMRIPQTMAYGLLAFLPPVYGLYTAFFSAILYPVFGGSNHMVAGAQGVVSMIVGVGIKEAFPKNARLTLEEKVKISVTITFMTGVIQCLLGLLRFGFLTNYLSDPLIGGFTTGAAVTVVVSQLPAMLGIGLNTTYSGNLNMWYSLIDIFENIRSTNYITLVISLFCLTFLILSKYLSSRFIKKIKVPIPGELIVMIASILFSYYLKIGKRWGVHLLGNITQGFPSLSLPTPHLMLTTLHTSISAAIVSFAVGFSVSKRLALRNGYNLNGNREIFAFGFMNTVGSFFNTFVASASMSASSIHESLGGVSQLANLFASVLVLFAFLFLGSLFQNAPECVLSTVILINLQSILFQFGDLKSLWKVSKIDFLLWFVTFVAVLICDVNFGLIIGVGFSLLTIVFRTQWPYCCLLGRISSTDIYKNIALTPAASEISGIKIFRFEGSLYFASSDHFTEALKYATGIDASKILMERTERQKRLNLVKEKAHSILGQDQIRRTHSDLFKDEEELGYLKDLSVHHIIVDLSTCSFIDSVGVRTLMQQIHDYRTININVFLANLNSAVRAMIYNSKDLYNVIKDEHLFISIHDAVLGALEDEEFIEERNFIIHDATLKSCTRYVSRISSDTDLYSRLSSKHH